MRKWLIIGSIAIVVLALAGGGMFFYLRSRKAPSQPVVQTPSPTAPPVRTNASCDLFNTREFGAEYTRGVWGSDIPLTLQQLPTGATLCGFIPSIQATFFLANNLDDTALFTFYRILLTNAGCTIYTEQNANSGGGPNSRTKTSFRSALLFTCKSASGRTQIGSVSTYNEQNAYLIVLSNPASTP